MNAKEKGVPSKICFQNSSDLPIAMASRLKALEPYLGARYMHVMICVTGSILCFLPIYGKEMSYMENSPFGLAVKSGEFVEISSLITLTLSFPMIVEKLVDVGLQIRSMDKLFAIDVYSDFLNDIEWILISLGFSISPAMALVSLWSPIPADNTAFVSLCAFECRGMLVLGASGMTLSRICPIYFRGWGVSVSLFLFAISRVVNVYGSNFLVHDNDTRGPPLAMLRNVTMYSAVIIMYLMVFFWLFGTWINPLIKTVKSGEKEIPITNPGPRTSSLRSLRKVSLKNILTGITTECPVDKTANNRRLHNNQVIFNAKHEMFDTKLFQQIFIAFMIIGLTILLIINGIRGHTVYLDENAFFMVDVTFTVLQVILMILMVQRTKSEVINTLYRLLETRKSYIRYLSHELRTPLNSGVLGLNLIITGLEDRDQPKDTELFETAVDIRKSLASAVEILDGLMLYDKIENGIETLKLEEVQLLNFLDECISPFKPQARQDSVCLSVYTSAGDCPGIGSYPRDATAGSRMLLLQQCNNCANEANQGDVESCRIQSSDKVSPIPSRTPSRLHSRTPSSKLQRSRSNSVIQLTDALMKAAIVFTKAKHASQPVEEDDTVSIDKHKMAQVVRNSISNALKFSPHDGQGKVEVNVAFLQDRVMSRMSSSSKLLPLLSPEKSESWWTRITSTTAAAVQQQSRFVRDWFKQEIDIESGVRMKRDDVAMEGKLQITVTDNGIGMSEENQVRLFNECSLLNPEVLTAGGGAGLGLLITKGIVDLHGGSIRVFSEGEGKGCTFTVEIPMTRKALPSRGRSAFQNDMNGRGDNIDVTLPTLHEAAAADLLTSPHTMPSRTFAFGDNDSDTHNNGFSPAGTATATVTAGTTGNVPMKRQGSHRLARIPSSSRPQPLVRHEESPLSLSQSQSQSPSRTHTPTPTPTQPQTQRSNLSSKTPSDRPLNLHGFGNTEEMSLCAESLSGSGSEQSGQSGEIKYKPQWKSARETTPKSQKTRVVSSLSVSVDDAAAPCDGDMRYRDGGANDDDDEQAIKMTGLMLSVDRAPTTSVTAMCSDSIRNTDNTDHVNTNATDNNAGVQSSCLTPRSLVNPSSRSVTYSLSVSASESLADDISILTPRSPSVATGNDNLHFRSRANNSGRASEIKRGSVYTTGTIGSPSSTPKSGYSSPSARQSQKKAAYDGPKYKILIVDDSDLTRKMLKKTLAAAGHEYEEAEDGVAAVEKVRQYQLQQQQQVIVNHSNGGYDCILMDYVMPNMDGPTATKEIRNIGFRNPIFGVTGNMVDTDIQTFRSAGADDVFSKPFDVNKFHVHMSGRTPRPDDISVCLSPRRHHPQPAHPKT